MNKKIVILLATVSLTVAHAADLNPKYVQTSQALINAALELAPPRCGGQPAKAKHRRQPEQVTTS